MRKAILIVLTMLMLIVPAYAADEDDPGMDQPIQQEKQPVIVASLEELQEAIDAADDGDTIAIDSNIVIDGETLETEKHITLIRTEKYAQDGNKMITIQGGGTISGFTIFESGIYHDSIYVDKNEDKTATINNCTFSVDKDCRLSAFINVRKDNSLIIKGCTFYTGNGYVIYADDETKVLIDSCNFEKGNYFGWPFIATYGNITIEECTFSAEVGYITCALDGVITISDCDFAVNYHKKKIYPNIYIAGSQLSQGTLNILDESIEGEGYYDLYTGQKIELPLTKCTELSVLAYMTDEQAVAHFAIEGNLGKFDLQYDEMLDIDEPENDPNPPDTDDSDGEDTLPEQPETPQEPGEQDEDTDTADDENTPQEPTEDNTQEPSHTGNSDNNYTPSTPSQPSNSTVTDKEEPKQEQEPAETERPPEDESAPIQQLVCGEARIDTSRTIVLLGYGDGLLHEDDPLTRAQMVTIIYRLLDDNGIARYNNAELTFTDVAPGAWYAPYVGVIQTAGIVNGVGDGMYDPDGIVTWAQIVTVLSRFVEPEDYTLQHIQYDGWAQEAIQTAVALGWIEDSADFAPDAIISRGALVELVNDVLALYR